MPFLSFPRVFVVVTSCWCAALAEMEVTPEQNQRQQTPMNLGSNSVQQPSAPAPASALVDSGATGMYNMAQLLQNQVLHNQSALHGQQEVGESNHAKRVKTEIPGEIPHASVARGQGSRGQGARGRGGGRGRSTLSQEETRARR